MVYSYARCYINPKVLLRGKWQKCNRKKMYVFAGVWFFVLMNSFIIFLWNYLTLAIAPKENQSQKKPTKLE